MHLANRWRPPFELPLPQFYHPPDDEPASEDTTFRATRPDYNNPQKLDHVLSDIAYEYLWKAANLLFDEADPERLVWVKTHTTHLLDSATSIVIDP